MSSPPNPLDKYQSYSYHHFLIAANSTEALRQLETGALSFRSLSGMSNGDVIDGKFGKVVMIINTMVDSKYVIDSFEYTNLYMNVENSTDRMTHASELDMVIKEANGATFLNFMRRVSDEILETSFSSTCFMIRTFFVGHKADGTTDHIKTNPISLQMGEMNSNFDHTGGTHSVRFYGLTNGAPLKNHNLHYINRNMNLTTKPNSVLLKDLVEDFENKLNAQLEQHWNLVRQSTGGNGRRVKYKFTLPKDWETYTVRSTTKDNFVERAFVKEKPSRELTYAEREIGLSKRQTVNIDRDRFQTTINVSMRTTVTQVLAEIFKHCDQIAEAFVSNSQLSPQDQNLAKLHQVVTSITSDANLVTVHFDVVDYYLPKLPTEEEKAVISKKINDYVEGYGDNGFDKYGMTYDYIFTGMNSDIIQMEMKLINSNTLLITNQTGIQKATGSMTATSSTVQAASANANLQKPQTKEIVTTSAVRKNDAVFFPDMSYDAQHGFIYAAPDAAQLKVKYQNMLALLAAATTTNLNIVVRGNPVFMSQMVRPLFPHDDTEYERELERVAELAKSKAQKLDGDIDLSETTHIFGDVAMHIPQFVKININTPLYDDNGNLIGFEPFWYQGRYRITHLKNRFHNGAFDQELYLLPYDLKGLEG